MRWVVIDFHLLLRLLYFFHILFLFLRLWIVVHSCEYWFGIVIVLELVIIVLVIYIYIFLFHHLGHNLYCRLLVLGQVHRVVRRLFRSHLFIQRWV